MGGRHSSPAGAFAPRTTSDGIMTLIFVCTSNTCRSPMAEGLGRKWIQDNGFGDKVRVMSRGLTDAYEKPGSPASAHAVTAVAKYGVDIAAHRSALMTPAELGAATFVLCVSGSHREWLLEMDPAAADRISTLGEDIPDPWHQALPVYQVTADTLARVVPARMERLRGQLEEAVAAAERAAAEATAKSKTSAPSGGGAGGGRSHGQV